MRALATFAVVAAGCGPVLPASDRVPVSGGQSTSQGDEGTQPGSDAPLHDDGDVSAGDDVKYDVDAPNSEVDGDTGEVCPRMRDVEPLQSAIELVVDVSQTMATSTVDHDENPLTESITRWHMLSASLEVWLPVLGDRAWLDLMIFPAIDAEPPPSSTACEASIGPGLGTPAHELLAELPLAESTFMQGANPLAGAIGSAQSMLQGVEDSAERTIVVFTDGAPNCGDLLQPPELFDQVNDQARGWAEYALALGIRTYVVAIAVPEGEYGGSQGEPVANHLAVLDGIAAAGGTALLSPQSAAQLDDALDFVVQQSRSCRASIPAELAGSWVNVEIEGQAFYEIGLGECFGEPGFVWVDDGVYDTIELCGTACDLFLANGFATLVEQCVFPE